MAWPNGRAFFIGVLIKAGSCGMTATAELPACKSAVLISTTKPILTTTKH
jgi:hypothetical protein